MHHLVGMTEIADLLGLTRQRVHQLVQTDPTFPKPEAELVGGRIWKRVDIERWARKAGRSLEASERTGRTRATPP
jgi:predicted DNA-binding transcriptional regulator AlpA